MDGIRQERPNNDPIVKDFIASTVSKQEIWHTLRQIFKTLKK